MTTFLISIMAFLYFGAAQAADFEGATEFESYNIRGKYIVSCISGKVRKTIHYCKAHGMHPYGWARLSHKTQDKVTNVTVKSTGENGKVVTKSSIWDQELQQSFKQFNLFKNNLFQTALLQTGENQVEWELTNGSKVVEKGVFSAHVTRGNHLICPDMTETKLFNSKYCEDGMAACERYFERVQDCEPVPE